MSKFMSRKFLMAVVGGIVVIINAILEANGYPAMDVEKVLAFAAIIIGYIAAEGYADGKGAVRYQVNEYVNSSDNTED